MGFLSFLRLEKLLHQTNHSPSSKSLPLALFPATEYNVPAVLWANSIQTLPDSKECRIRSIVHCQTMSGPQHEFLLVYIQHPSGKEAIMLVDRDPSSDISSVFSEDTVAHNGPVDRNALRGPPNHDRVKLSYDGTERCVTRHISSWAEIHALKYPKPSKAPTAGHLAALLLTLNRHHLPSAFTGEQRSAWFVYCAIEVLKELFGGDVRRSKKWVRAPYGGMEVDERDLAGAVSREFSPVWEDFSKRRKQRGGRQSLEAAQSHRQEEKKAKKKEQTSSHATDDGNLPG